MALRQLVGSALLLVGMSASLVALPASAQTTTTFTLEPGGKATINYEAFCTDFGKKFPTALQSPNAVAPAKLQGGVEHIRSNNLGADEQKALDAQYGIWQLAGATNSPQGGDIAKAVVNAGSTAPATPQGTSLLDAVKSNQVKLTLGTWAAVGNPVAIGAATDHFYGRGTLTVENTSQQALTLYMPVGTLFPPNTAGDQTMAAYSTDVQVSNPQPARLPQTAEGSSPLPLVALVALGLVALAGGFALRRTAR